MNKSDVIKAIVTDSDPRSEGQAFACANIALCKYWGKRNSELNLPVTSSLSIGLGEKGSITHIKVIEQQQDQIYLNNVECDPNSAFSQRVVQFLELFRGKKQYRFLLQTSSNIPVAAGLASSASGFASLTLALDQLFQWQLHPHQLSIFSTLRKWERMPIHMAWFC